jgi:hypothetical protein
MDELMWAEAKVQMAWLSNIKKHVFQFDVEQIYPNLRAFQKLKEVRFKEKALRKKLIIKFVSNWSTTNEFFCDHNGLMNTQEHICLHLMRISMSMNVHYNTFAMLEDSEEPKVA